MTDYKKLVEDLKQGVGHWYRKDSARLVAMFADAAAAIEALEAEVKRLEPKRGEWTEIEDYDGDFHYQCSVCGEEWYFIDGTPADNNANYCPRCGAKMEVQE